MVSSFISVPGGLLELTCPTNLSRSSDTPVETRSTLGGRRKAFTRRGGRRAWSVDITTARPHEVSTVETIARTGAQVGWYGPDAVIGNLLSPQASGFEPIPANATDAGLVALPDGSVARAVAYSGSGYVTAGDAHGTYEAVPVRPGVEVTVGAWAFGGVRLTGWWRDADDNRLWSYNGPVEAFTGWQWREFTVMPPPEAHTLSLNMNYGVQFARPSIAWGRKGRDQLGTGCPAAVFHSPSHDAVALRDDANYSDSGYQVTEVG